MKGSRGRLLLLLIFFALLLHRGRAVLPSEGPPAFFMEEVGVPVHLGKGFPVSGIHQFYDGMLLSTVIGMTASPALVRIGPEDLPALPLRPGESLSLSSSPGQGLDLTRVWLPAGQRIALGIPLHPDCMTREDWEFLPGIGLHLSEVIEMDRQLNGDFGSLESLDRVKGIGPKRIERWREFF